MTLIFTQLSKFGIIHGTDSNVVFGERHVKEREKVFEIPYLKAALAVSGAYSVGGEYMDSWMKNFIQLHDGSGFNLGEFARELGRSLQTNVTADERHEGIMIHVAGYVQAEGGYHPEFHFVRNVHRISEDTGEYLDIDGRFDVDEHFWNRDWPEQDLMKKFHQGDYWYYINGFPPGRIGFNILTAQINELLRQLLANKGWAFREPNSLVEHEKLVILYLSAIITMFELSDYTVKVIGGRVQTFPIPDPAIASKC